jgi:hypothetical protein
MDRVVKPLTSQEVIMPIVIAGGPSVNDYERIHVENLARCGFTFAVNETCFNFPCDVVVSIDPWLINYRTEELRKLGKPIITRKWEWGKDKKLDLIEVPNDIVELYPLSGMLAVKLADRLAAEAGDRLSYVLGMDGDGGHYKGHPSPKEYDPIYKSHAGKYDRLGLTHTRNLSVHSKIDSWPKLSKLPKWDKVIVDPKWKEIAITWLRCNAGKAIFEGIKK